MFCVYRVYWTEYELGWGSKFYAYTLHKDKSTCQAFVDDYAKKNLSASSVPDYYISPSEPKIVEVSKNVFDQVNTQSTVWDFPPEVK